MLDTNIFPLNLSKSEKVQLERGDVPYFFKFIGSDQLLFLTDKSNSESEVLDISEFRTDIVRHAKHPKLLIGNLLAPDIRWTHLLRRLGVILNKEEGVQNEEFHS